MANAGTGRQNAVVAGAGTALTQQALLVARKELDALPDDDWMPSVQGAVSHVIGLRSLSNSLVMKLFTADGSRSRAERERRALELVSDYAGVPLPRLVTYGEIPAPTPVPYLIMTRLPGVRWADRRPRLTVAESLVLHRRAGSLLRQFHRESHRHGPRPFGGLLNNDPNWPSLDEAVMERREHLARRYRDHGGSAELIGQVERFLTRRQHALNSCQKTVLCHNDFIDGNLLVTAAGDPVITGVIDLERASFDDPMADLAQTLRNATFHQPSGAEELAAAYGVDAADQERLAIHDLLHTLAERVWISTDRPTGWRSSVRRLDAHLHCVSQRP
jgi:aminoglycoside phosphotransferase (APT) family kinase protein